MAKKIYRVSWDRIEEAELLKETPRTYKVDGEWGRDTWKKEGYNKHRRCVQGHLFAYKDALIFQQDCIRQRIEDQGIQLERLKKRLEESQEKSKNLK